MSNSIAPGSSADVNIKVTALTTNPNVPVTYKTIILKKNLVNGVNTLMQEMMSATNTKYVIKYDYVLGENITIPDNCVLEFDGGSISSDSYSIGGTILNETIYSKWFGNGDCLVKSLNRLNGYNIVVLENKVFEVTVPISIVQPCIIYGNGATFKRSDMDGTSSLCAVDINPNDKIEKIVFNNINFDGGFTRAYERNTATVLTKGIYIKNVNNVVFNNVKIENYNMKIREDESTDYDSFIHIDTYSTVLFDNVKIDKVYVSGELTWFVPEGNIPIIDKMVQTENNVFPDGDNCVEIKNSYFNGVYWSPICLYGGKFIFKNNIIDFSSGSAINCFVYQAFILNNTFNNNVKSDLVDFVESVPHPYSLPYHVEIKGNIANNNHGRGFLITGENIYITENKIEYGNITDSNVASCDKFVTFVNCKNVIVSNNIVLNCLSFIHDSASLTAEVIVIKNNYITCAQNNMQCIRLWGNKKDYYIENNIFILEDQKRYVISLRQDGNTIENLVIRDNIFYTAKNRKIFTDSIDYNKLNTKQDISFYGNISKAPLGCTADFNIAGIVYNKESVFYNKNIDVIRKVADIEGQNLALTDENSNNIFGIIDINGKVLKIPVNSILDLSNGKIINSAETTVTINVNRRKILPDLNALLTGNINFSGIPTAGTLYWQNGKPTWSDGTKWIYSDGTPVTNN